MKSFKQMKTNCVFINIARGALVNHDDLAQALKTKIIFSAGILTLNELFTY